MTSFAESEGARRARHFRALERRLFEVLGGWVPSAPEPEVKLLLRAHSFQHAWHADLWGRLLPADERPAPVSAPLPSPLAGAVNEVAGLEDSVGRLVAVYRVLLPGVVAAYASLQEGVDEASGGPLVRALGLMLADDEAACRAGQALVQTLLDGEPDAGRAIEQARRIEALLLAAGGVEAIDVV